MFASREVAEERQIEAERQWKRAKRNWKGCGAGCLVLILLAALALFWLAGYVAALNADCVTRVSTP